MAGTIKVPGCSDLHRKLDLTPLDFFFWRFVKDQVYATPVRNIVDLRNKITNAVGNITQIIIVTNTFAQF